MISFGPMSITLLIGALYGVLFAVLLWFTRTNTLANRFLALLMLAFVLRMVPCIIGYAGFYDNYLWLSFMPYNVSLAFGPLLYLSVRLLSMPSLPRGWWWHFVPVAIQIGYYCVMFVQPLSFKNEWNDSVHEPIIDRIELSVTFYSIAMYWYYSLVHHRQYQRWLAANVSQAEDNRIEWVRNFLLAFAVTVALWLGFVLFDQFGAKLNYFHRFPFYVWLGVLLYYLGTEGYRHARHRYPVWDEPIRYAGLLAAEGEPYVSSPSTREVLDINARAEKWRVQLVTAQWWRDTELTLSSLARKLGTNTTDLSRAINEGMGMNFNELINRLRVEEVKRVLSNAGVASEQNLLDVAFAAGFSSKASFNRCFKLYTGQTPTEFRNSLST
jgi:AraC-like DNA-binding protein